MRRFGGRSRHVVDFLVDEVLEAHDPATQDADAPLVDPRAPVRPAVRRGARTGGLRRSCSRRSPARTCSSCRSTTRASGTASITSSPSCCASSSSTASRASRRRSIAGHSRGTATTARSTRRSSMRSKAGAFAEAGELIAAAWIDYVTRSLATRRSSPGSSGSRASSCGEDPQLLLVQAWVLSLSAKREAAADAIAALERLGGSTRARCPTASARSRRAWRRSRATIPWGDVGAGLENAPPRGRAGRAGVAVATRSSRARLGACLYFSGEFDEADALARGVDRARRSRTDNGVSRCRRWPTARSSRAS